MKNNKREILKKEQFDSKAGMNSLGEKKSNHWGKKLK